MLMTKSIDYYRVKIKFIVIYMCVKLATSGLLIENRLCYSIILDRLYIRVVYIMANCASSMKVTFIFQIKIKLELFNKNNIMFNYDFYFFLFDR